MKCPLSNYVMERESGEEEVLIVDCLKKECAWWRQEYPACCIYSIERALWTIAVELGTIQHRMPHVEQFKK